MTNEYNQIVPKSIREELEAGARSESDWLWTVGDRAVFIYDRYNLRKEAGEKFFVDLVDADVWRAIGHFAKKSPSRIARLAQVARAFPPKRRETIQEKYDQWDFGYFERTINHAEPEKVFEFLSEYREGFINQPARKLGVGEFMVIFETHIEGKQMERNPHAGHPGVDLSTIALGLPFQDVLNYAKQLRRKLLPHIHKPHVKRVVDLAVELEKEIPQAMREVGYVVQKNGQEVKYVDKPEEISI